MIIHHVGLIVKNIEKHYSKFFMDTLGYKEISQIYNDYNIGVRVAFINLNNKIYLELVEPLKENSPVSNYLQKFGQSLHHLCFEVDNLEIECERLRNNNYFITMPPTPAVAFEGRKVAFLMSKDENYLIELLQKQ
ncbi:MAG: VOC family protein [Bacteroidota bacterium]